MAATMHSLFIFTVLLGFVSFGIAVNTLEPSTECANRCKEAVPEYFDLKHKSEFEGCLRGCRFFMIAKLVHTKKDDGFNNVDLCTKSCDEAYIAESVNNKACLSGCRAEADIEKTNAVFPEEPVMDPEEQSVVDRLKDATPVLQIRKVMGQVIDGFQVLRTQLVTYFVREEDHTLIAVESPAQVVIDRLPSNGLGAPSSEDLLHNEISQGAPQFQREDPFSEFNSPSETVTRVSLGPVNYAYFIHLLVLLGCVSFALLAISYCLSFSRRHHQRSNNKASNLSTALQQEPLKLVRPEDLTKLSLMEEEEAPPLPNKQELALSHAKV